MNPEQPAEPPAQSGALLASERVMQTFVPESAPSPAIDLALPLFAMKVAFGFTLFSLEITRAIVQAAAGDKKPARQ